MSDTVIARTHYWVNEKTGDGFITVTWSARDTGRRHSKMVPYSYHVRDAHETACLDAIPGATRAVMSADQRRVRRGYRFEVTV